METEIIATVLPPAKLAKQIWCGSVHELPS